MANEYYKAGVKLAAMAAGVPSEQVAELDGITSHIDNPKVPGYGNLQRLMCKYAAEAFKEAGEMTSFEYCMFKEASEAPEWFPEFDHLSNSVFKALGRTVEYAREDENFKAHEAIKEASSGLLFPALAGGVVRNTPALIKQIATLGLASGAGIGSLAWLLNRHSRQDEDEIEAIKAKRDYYRKLTSEIRDELGGIESPNDQHIEEAIGNVI